MFAFGRNRDFLPRTIRLGYTPEGRFAKNVVRNQKYSVLTFVPLVSVCLNILLFGARIGSVAVSFALVLLTEWWSATVPYPCRLEQK